MITGRKGEVTALVTLIIFCLLSYHVTVSGLQYLIAGGYNFALGHLKFNKKKMPFKEQLMEAQQSCR